MVKADFPETMNPAIVQLAGLSYTQVTHLAQVGVANEEDLSVLTFEDLDQMLPTATRIVHRKLSNIAQFLRSGKEVNGITTMCEVNQGLPESVATSNYCAHSK
jgi:hypothetical protein